MSFGPSKNKNIPKRSGINVNLSKDTEEIKHDNGEVSKNNENVEPKHSQSNKSQHEVGFSDRFSQLSNNVARLQQQQDAFTELLEMKTQFDQMQKNQEMVYTLMNRVNQMEGHIGDLEARFDEYQAKTEKFLVVLDQNIDAESKIRESENKKMKKVSAELEKRQKEMAYEVKMDIRNSEIKAKEDMVAVTSDIDRKVEAYKEFFEENVDNLHRNLKSNIVDDEDKLNNLNEKLSASEKILEKRVEKLEKICFLQVDQANKRRKVDYEDLKAWLLESIDNRLNAKEEKLEKTVKKNLNSTVVKQKYEINSLKREMTALSSVSPVVKYSSFGQDGQQEETQQKFNEDESENRKSVGGEEPNYRSGKHNSTNKYIENFEKPSPSFIFQQRRNEMDNIENSIIESGDQIGMNLDQQKIKIYEWKRKIEKATKKNAALRKTKKKSAKTQIKGKPEFERDYI